MRTQAVTAPSSFQARPPGCASGRASRPAPAAPGPAFDAEVPQPAGAAVEVEPQVLRADDPHQPDQGRQQAGARRDRHGPAGAGGVCHPADERRPKGSSAHEDRHVEGHHPAPHYGLRGGLDVPVGARHHGDREQPHGHKCDAVPEVVRGHRCDARGHAEGGGRPENDPQPWLAAAGGQQGPGDGSDGHDRIHQAEGPRVEAEFRPHHGRDEQGEIQPQGSHDEDRHQHHDQVRTVPHIAQPLPDPALARRCPRQPAQRRRRDFRQAQQQGHEGERIDEEDPAGPDDGREHAGDGRADHPGNVEGRAVQGHGIGEVVVLDQFRDEGLPDGGVQGRDHPEHQGERVDVPELRRARDHQDAQPRAQQRHGGLGQHQEPLAVETIGDQSGHGCQEELRAQLQGHRDPHRPGIVRRQVGEHQPVLGGALHPGANVGNKGADEPDPVVQDVQGFERGHQPQPSPDTLPDASNR